MVPLSQISLVGWWPGCEFDSSSFKCTGTSSSFEPVQLDPSGQQCYVNPFREEKDAVHWFGKDPSQNSTDIFIYTVIIEDDVAKDYYPTLCENGVCLCGSIESLRKNWDSSGLKCTTPLVSCAKALANFDSTSCGIIASLSYDNPDSRTACMFQAKLQTQDLSIQKISGAPPLLSNWNGWALLGSFIIMLLLR
mmetsp:Transcript_26966/g.41332  ORF Transcript_26966/g.41332 Transcript_26966/m.41332 type:complete len:193 (-) Transcript_26966:1156-1734(-)